MRYGGVIGEHLGAVEGYLLGHGRAVQGDERLVQEGLVLRTHHEGAPLTHDKDVVGVEGEVGAVEDELALNDEQVP